MATTRVAMASMHGDASDLSEDGLAQTGFWQKKWVQNLLPAATSIALHAGLIGAAFATYKAVTVIVEVVHRDQLTIADTTFNAESPIGGVKFTGIGGLDRDAAQDLIPDVPVNSTSWSTVASEIINVNPGGQSGNAEGSAVIGLGSAASIGGPGGDGHGTGPGKGNGHGPGGGDLAPFGYPSLGGFQGPKSVFQGPNSGVTQIAYVCDASGSMMNKFDPLKLELQKAVGSLSPVQAFNVIFFQEGTAATASRQGLMMAKPDNKQKAYAFLDEVSLASNSDPAPALKLAFEQKPQLIYLLTDGEFPDNEKVIAQIRRLNASGNVKINTIAFADADEEDAPYVQVLKQIAQENGGIFKFVTADDLKN